MGKDQPALKRSITIELQFPLTVKDADGKSAKRDELTMHRPTFAEAKKLALIIGPHFLKEFMAGDKSTEIDAQAIAGEALSAIATEEGLAGITEVIASLCGESVEIIDQLDWLDLVPVGKAVFDFFPALQSIVPTS